MTLVVDASVAVKWFIDEVDSKSARALLVSGERLVAPDLVVAELCNAAWRLERIGRIAAAQGDRIAARAGAAFAALVPALGLATRALTIARVLAHPVYDCLYLALAEAEAGTVVTCDQRLAACVAGTPFARRVITLEAWG